jgi:prolyl-tRNA editing enzyme YbaK/EbsC (Cys-tRNA(Pro) deacylase)
VRDYAAERGVTIAIRRFERTTRTAEDAAREIGTEVARIVKSLVFIAGGDAVVALCSGQTRVDEALLAATFGVATVRRATADEAKTFTGYAIGGVPPFAHSTPCRVVADRALLSFDEVWAAAGLPDAVFAIAPGDLVRISDAMVATVAR